MAHIHSIAPWKQTLAAAALFAVSAAGAVTPVPPEEPGAAYGLVGEIDSVQPGDDRIVVDDQSFRLSPGTIVVDSQGNQSLRVEALSSGTAVRMDLDGAGEGGGQVLRIRALDEREFEQLQDLAEE